jgi:hypothetical protein
MPGPLGIGGGGGGSGGTVTTPVFPFIDRAVAQTSDTGSITFATPGSSAIGDTAAAGTATTVARSDHVHGREAAGTPGASAVGDTASAGVATTVARSDHRHSREAFGTPVTIDGTTTSLSAGSLTTVARADHVHTLSNVSGGMLIASATLASDAAGGYTFSSIPQNYRHLKLVVSVRSNIANYNAYQGVRFNNDSAANYPNTEQGITTSPYTWGYFYLSQGTAAQAFSYPNFGELLIYDYSSSSAGKFCAARTITNVPTTSSNYQILDFLRTFVWVSTSAITSILYNDFSNGLKAGGRLWLYGIY